jgi:hypothetical protein
MQKYCNFGHDREEGVRKMARKKESAKEKV